MKIKKKILLIMGIFLLLDGILSIYYGNSCLNNCLNNNTFGNIIRIIRAISGGYLIKISL